MTARYEFEDWAYEIRGGCLWIVCTREDSTNYQGLVPALVSLKHIARVSMEDPVDRRNGPGPWTPERKVQLRVFLHVVGGHIVLHTWGTHQAVVEFVTGLGDAIGSV